MKGKARQGRQSKPRVSERQVSGLVSQERVSIGYIIIAIMGTTRSGVNCVFGSKTWAWQRAVMI